jgi:hypothetical protein
MDLEDQFSYSLKNKAQNVYLVLSRNNKYLFLHLLSKHRPLNPDSLTFSARKFWELFVLLASVLLSGIFKATQLNLTIYDETAKRITQIYNTKKEHKGKGEKG